MTDPVGRTQTLGLQRSASDADFNSSVRNALGPRGNNGSRSPGRNGTGNGSDDIKNPVTLAGLPDGRQLSDFGAVNADGSPLYQGSPVSAATQSLIDDANRYDREGNPDPSESARRWNFVQSAIAAEVRGMLPVEAFKVDAPAPQLSPELQAKLGGLNVWAQGTDRLATETNEAILQIDNEVKTSRRDRVLDQAIDGVEDSLDKVKAKNDDHNVFRKGWDAVSGGGAGDDFVEYLEDKRGQLTALDARDDGLTDAQYLQEMKTILGDFDVKFQQHVENMVDSDETWNTVGEVGRVVASVAAGIVTTAATGGNFGLGFAAALGTYEVIDGVGDVVAMAKGEDMYADGHSGILTGLFDLAGGNGGFGFEGGAETAKAWALDNVVDTISSVGTAGSTKAAMAASKWAGTKLGATTWGQAHNTGTRVLATTAGGFTAQTVNSGAYLATDLTRMGFAGDFDGKLFVDSLKTQGIYLISSLPTSAIAGRIPLYKEITAASGASAADYTHKLSYLGVTGQLANDTVSNFATAYAVDQNISKADAIAALFGVLPGTLQNVVVRPDTRALLSLPDDKVKLHWRTPVSDLKTWGRGVRDWVKGSSRDVQFTSWDGFPPSGIRLRPITTTVLGLRAALLAADGKFDAPVSKTTNEFAVPLSALRSSLSKFAWFRGNHRLVRAYDLALAGDARALDVFLSTQENRGKHGVKVDPKAKTGVDSPEYKEVEALLGLGKAYAAARSALPPDQQKLLPELSVRSLTSPEAVLQGLRDDSSVPPEVRALLQSFDPDVRLLQYSNVVEGLLTDPEFLISGIEALGVKLAPSDVDEIRQIFNVLKALELDPSKGGYTSSGSGPKWTDATWWGEGGTKSVFDTEVARINDEAQTFLHSHGTSSAASHTLLTNLIGAWQAYAPLYSRNQSGAPGRPVQELATARTAYQDALKMLPRNVRDLMSSPNWTNETPQQLLSKLRQSEALPDDVRLALVDFKPATYLLENPGTFQSLKGNPNLLNDTVGGLETKLPKPQFDSIKVIMDVYQLLKSESTTGFNNRQQGTPWNELGWRQVRDDRGNITKLGIFDEDVDRLDRFVTNFLSRESQNAGGTLHPDAKPLLDAWQSYIKLFSQTQHDMYNSLFEPGIDRLPVEQKLGSSASPDTKYGYMLKASAYGVAVNLVYSWMMRPTPATDGLVNSGLWTAWGGEAALSLYNLGGQIGYMKALGAMTAFKAKHDKWEYTPSDLPEHVKVFDPALAKEFKRLSGRRAFWNAVADWGSVISAGRNFAMTAAYASMGLPVMAWMSSINAVFSLGWFGVQRTPLQTKLSPPVANAIRWASIIGGAALQWGVLVQTLRMAEEIGEKRGDQGASAADFLEARLMEIVDWLVDQDAIPGEHESANPLPDRA